MAFSCPGNYTVSGLLIYLLQILLFSALFDVFPRFTAVWGFPRKGITSFPALFGSGSGCMLSCDWIGTSCMSSRAWHLLQAFRRFQARETMQLLPTSYTISLGYRICRAFRLLQGFPRLAPVVRLPALSTNFVFVTARHRPQVFTATNPFIVKSQMWFVGNGF